MLLRRPPSSAAWTKASAAAPIAAKAGPGRSAGAKDVARLAGVSTATVSRTLNLPEQVDPRHARPRAGERCASCATCRTALRASLRSQRSRMVGAIVPSFDYALYARTTSALQRRFDAPAATRWCWPSITTTCGRDCGSPAS